jgi:hydroxymethylpyrimidine/phosphomethylpyrimidine kinase
VNIKEGMNQPINSAWPVVLSVAGFDPSAGAGIVADLKTFAAHHCYGMAAITAMTVQNTQGVASVHPVEPSVLRASILSLLAHSRVRAVKIGMLGNSAIADVVRELLEANPDIPAVLDPVVRSSNNFELLDAAGLEFVRRQLLSRVTVVTPNLAEAAALAEMPVENLEGMKAAARRLVEFGARAVVVTGGHLDKAIDVFFDGTKMESFAGDRVKPDYTHGTGCTFSSAVAANLALGRHLRDAVVLAKAYVVEAIRQAFPVGAGRLPLNHLYRMAQPARLTDHSPEVAEPVH